MRIDYSPYYKNIPYRSRIILYGAGVFGRRVWESNCTDNHMDIIAVVDAKANEISDFPSTVLLPERIKDFNDYDYILVAVKDKLTQESIISFLNGFGIDKIKTISSSSDVKYSYENLNPLQRRSNDGKQLKVGINLRPAGLGDQIFALKVYQTLNEMIGECSIDLYSERPVFTEVVFNSQDNLGQIYRREAVNTDWKEYDLFIDVSWQILIRQYNDKKIGAFNPKLLRRIEKHVEYQKTEFVDLPEEKYTDIVLYERAKIKSKNRYTLYSEGGLFEIADSRVKLFLDGAYEADYKGIGLSSKYITFNYGANAVEQKGVPQIKMWPKEYHSALNTLLKQRFKDVEIVQLGTKGAEKIPGADRYVLGENLETVKYVLKNALLHIDCEGGLMHLATQLGTKCVVLYGPTLSWFVGYEQNINIEAEECGGCMGSVSKNGWFSCYRGDKPDCMYSIKPKKVAKIIEKEISHEY